MKATYFKTLNEVNETFTGWINQNAFKIHHKESEDKSYFYCIESIDTEDLFFFHLTVFGSFRKRPKSSQGIYQLIISKKYNISDENLSAEEKLKIALEVSKETFCNIDIDDDFLSVYNESIFSDMNHFALNLFWGLERIKNAEKIIIDEMRKNK